MLRSSLPTASVRNEPEPESALSSQEAKEEEKERNERVASRSSVSEREREDEDDDDATTTTTRNGGPPCVYTSAKPGILATRPPNLGRSPFTAVNTRVYDLTCSDLELPISLDLLIRV